MTVGATWHCVVGRNFGSFVTHGKYKREKERRKTYVLYCRIQTFYLFLSRSNRYSFIQICLKAPSF